MTERPGMLFVPEGSLETPTSGKRQPARDLMRYRAVRAVRFGRRFNGSTLERSQRLCPLLLLVDLVISKRAACRTVVVGWSASEIDPDGSSAGCVCQCPRHRSASKPSRKSG